VAVTGPLAFVAAFLAMAATPLWAPSGAAGIDHIVVPIVLFPAYWVTACLYGVIDGHLGRAASVLAAVALGSAVLIARALMI
jgi:hypothetical protein